MLSEKRFLVFGAHPDDPDQMFGGTAVKLIATGHKVKFVSTTNGNAGHYLMNPEDLAERRYKETQASAKITGLEEYQVMDNSDGYLEASIENRRRIVNIIRDFKPDVVISHRLNDYHADHRTTAQLVQDASYLVTVPLYSPEIAILEKLPVFACSWDHFQKPYPFRADAVVIIDKVIEDKIRMLDCHKSQFYEWLPWNQGYKDFNACKMNNYEKRQWLLDNWICNNAIQAKLYSDKRKSNYVEAFEQSEYGRQLSGEEFLELFLG